MPTLREQAIQAHNHAVQAAASAREQWEADRRQREREDLLRALHVSPFLTDIKAGTLRLDDPAEKPYYRIDGIDFITLNGHHLWLSLTCPKCGTRIQGPQIERLNQLGGALTKEPAELAYHIAEMCPVTEQERQAARTQQVREAAQSVEDFRTLLSEKLAAAIPAEYRTEMAGDAVILADAVYDALIDLLTNNP